MMRRVMSWLIGNDEKTLHPPSTSAADMNRFTQICMYMCMYIYMHMCICTLYVHVYIKTWNLPRHRSLYKVCTENMISCFVRGIVFTEDLIIYHYYNLHFAYVITWIWYEDRKRFYKRNEYIVFVSKVYMFLMHCIATRIVQRRNTAPWALAVLVNC